MHWLNDEKKKRLLDGTLSAADWCSTDKGHFDAVIARGRGNNQLRKSRDE